MTFNSMLAAAKQVPSGRAPGLSWQWPPPCCALPLSPSFHPLQTQGFWGAVVGKG